MFELMFLFSLSEQQIEWQFEEKYNSMKQCQKAGNSYAHELEAEIKEKYPNLEEFEIHCTKNRDLIHV